MNVRFKGPNMKKILFLLPLIFVACDYSFTYNGLQCPTNNMHTIENDMTECRVYDTKDIEKSFKKDPTCKTCLEDKGYTIKAFNSDNNASE